jgi:hypothetical protein
MGPKARLDSLEKRKTAFTEIIGLYSESRGCEVHELPGGEKNAVTPIVTTVDWMMKTICGGGICMAS